MSVHCSDYLLMYAAIQLYTFINIQVKIRTFSFTFVYRSLHVMTMITTTIIIRKTRGGTMRRDKQNIVDDI